MTRKKAGSPTTESEGVSRSEAATTLTKAEAIRRALAAGHDKPRDGIAYIREQFGIVIAPTHFSAAKSQIKAKAEKQARLGRRPKTIEGILAPPRRGRSANGAAGLIAAIEQMKPLVASLGVEKVKQIAELLA